MTLHDKIYGLHILGTVFLWGGALLSLLIAKKAIKKPQNESKIFWKLSIWTQWFIPIGALILSISGISLIHEGWGWFLGWLDISIGTTLWIIPFVIFRLHKSLMKISGEMNRIESTQSDLPPYLLGHYYQIFALLFLGTILMLMKPGTPMSVLLAAGTFALSWILQPKQ
jgi:hypothetical protein